MVKRPTVGAHYGTRDWIIQRATALYLVAYTVFFIFASFSLDGSQERWRTLFASGFTGFLTMLFFWALCYHAWIGVRDIFMDYVKPLGIRLALHVVIAFLLVGYAGWAARILWGL